MFLLSSCAGSGVLTLLWPSSPCPVSGRVLAAHSSCLGSHTDPTCSCPRHLLWTPQQLVGWHFLWGFAGLGFFFFVFSIKASVQQTCFRRPDFTAHRATSAFGPTNSDDISPSGLGVISLIMKKLIYPSHIGYKK